jgi:hypothetical protein
MNRFAWVVALGALLGACFESHDGNQRALTGDDCYQCHQPSYEQTAAPPHQASGFPISCVDCHTTISWQPALGNHPPPLTYGDAAGKNTTFLLSGDHDDIACFGCHDLAIGSVRYPDPPPSRGFNSNCIQCHPDDSDQRDAHVGRGFSFPVGTPWASTPYEYKPTALNFCRACHPEGTALGHPNDQFPRTGNHNTSCTSCHSVPGRPDADGANVSCMGPGCHSLAEEDREHDEAQYPTLRNNPPVGMYPWITRDNFCLVCHPRGKGD